MNTKAEIQNQWDEILKDPVLADIDDKFETNGQGQIILTPHKLPHSLYQLEIQKHLLRLGDGYPMPECPVLTDSGVKVVDVAWMDKTMVDIVKHQSAASQCPKICIEVWSNSNSKREREEKPKTYFQAGAIEVWTCTNGKMLFLDKSGEVKKSKIFPDFPNFISL